MGAGADDRIVVDDGPGGDDGSLADNGVGVDDGTGKDEGASPNPGGRADIGCRVDKGRNRAGKGFKTVKKLLPERKIAKADNRGGVTGGKIREIGNGSDGVRDPIVGKSYFGKTTGQGKFGGDTAVTARADDKNGGGDAGRFGWAE